MNHHTERKSRRVSVNMKLRSVSLPGYSASVVDLSPEGARIRFKGKFAANLVEDRIRFGINHQNQMGTLFEGYARVVWLRQTEDGIEGGLEWEKMSPSAYQKAVSACLVASAA